MNEPAKYTCNAVSVAELDGQTRRAMCDLYLSSYEATNAELFEGDLRSKDEALLLHFGPRLVGFTTLRVFDAVWQGRTFGSCSPATRSSIGSIGVSRPCR